MIERYIFLMDDNGFEWVNYVLYYIYYKTSTYKLINDEFEV